MVDIGSLSNTTALGNDIAQGLLDKFAPLVTIFKAIGIALLVYIIFLIIRALFKWKTSLDIGRIAGDVEEINKKMDVLIEKLSAMEERERNEEAPEIEKVKPKKKGLFAWLFGKKEIKEEDKIKKIKKKK